MIYFVQAEIIGRIKIGYSDIENVERRIAALQTTSPMKLNVIAIHPGTRDLEKSFHRRFSRDRVIGEWFFPSVDLMEGITQVRSRNRISLESMASSKSEFPREVRWFQDRFREQRYWYEAELMGLSADVGIPFSVLVTEAWRVTCISGIPELDYKGKNILCTSRT